VLVREEVFFHVAVFPCLQGRRNVFQSLRDGYGGELTGRQDLDGHCLGHSRRGLAAFDVGRDLASVNLNFVRQVRGVDSDFCGITCGGGKLESCHI